MNKLEFNICIKNLDNIQGKIDEVKALIKEINKTSLEVEVKPKNEIETMNDCANKIKNQELDS